MGIVAAFRRNDGAFDVSRFFLLFQQSMIFIPNSKTFLRNLIRFLKLGVQERGDHFAGQVTGADVDPSVFVDHAAEELAAVGAFFSDDLGAFEKAFVIDDEGTAFPGNEILGFVEAVAPQVSDRSEVFSLVCGAHTLGGVFHDQQIVAFGDVHDHIHVATNAGVMNRDDHLRFRRNGLLNELFIDVHGIGTNIDEHRDSAAQDKSIDRGDERVTRHDEFIAGLDVAKDCRHFQRGRTGMCQQDFLCLEMLFQPVIALFGEISVARQLPKLNCLCDIPKFFTDNVGLIKWNLRFIHDLSSPWLLIV